MNIDASHTLFVGLGSNIGDRRENLDHALTFLSHKIGRIQQLSKLYESEPWGVSTEQPNYYNMAVSIKTNLKAPFVLHVMQLIEHKMGRIREKKWEPRVIDLDLLYFDELILESAACTIPHPEIQNRRFVLTPLCDIDPAFVHPVLGKSQAQLLDACTDSGRVWVVS